MKPQISSCLLCVPLPDLQLATITKALATLLDLKKGYNLVRIAPGRMKCLPLPHSPVQVVWDEKPEEPLMQLAATTASNTRQLSRKHGQMHSSG